LLTPWIENTDCGVVLCHLDFCLVLMWATIKRFGWPLYW
jgi:hypothetical protein